MVQGRAGQKGQANCVISKLYQVTVGLRGSALISVLSEEQQRKHTTLWGARGGKEIGEAINPDLLGSVGETSRIQSMS